MYMENAIERGTKLIREWEQKLRSLVSDAASVGDYESVMTLTAWARSLASLIAERAELPDQGATTRSQREDASPFSHGGSRRKRAGTPRKPRAKGEYPKFLRRGNDLVKVGWSRRAKAEYEHKVPETVALNVTRAIAKVGSNSELTPTERFLSAVASEDGIEVPEYQAYVVLAWLRSLGLVARHGRQGYTVPQPGELATKLGLLWEQLPRI